MPETLEGGAAVQRDRQGGGDVERRVREGSSVPGPDTQWRCQAATRYMSLELRMED